MLAFLIFIFGTMVGSFLNVVILRLKDNEKFIRGRSHCPKCKSKLKWYENIPLLSFIFLLGKCKHCKQKISWQYFLVELATGLLFLLAFLNINIINIYLFYYFIILSFLIIIFVYDLKYYLILDKISIPAIIFVLIFKISTSPNSLTSLILSILSAIVISGFFLLQFIISKGKWIGGGDIRLGFLMGIILGWQMSLIALFLGYVLGLIISLPLLIAGRKKMKSEVAFGTFLVASTIITMFYGDKILEWYLLLF